MSGNKPRDTGKKTTVGGQALIEGVMMKGVSVGAMAVRKKDGDIHVEEWEGRRMTMRTMPVQEIRTGIWISICFVML